MSEQITLDAPDALRFSEDEKSEDEKKDGAGGAEPMTERPARLLETGDYPDKKLSLTASDLDDIAARFAADLSADLSEGVPVKVEHRDSPLDPLGSVRRVWREGSVLLATLAFPEDLAGFLRRRGAAKLSVGLTRDPLRLQEVSLVLKPRIPSATLMSGADGQEAGVGAKDAEIVRLRAELASREIEAHLAAFKAQGRIVPASEAPARALLASEGEATVTLSDGPEPVARVFKRFLEAQPPAILLSESASAGVSDEIDGGEGVFTQTEHTFLSKRLGVDPALVAAHLKQERDAQEAHNKQDKEQTHAH